MQEIGSSNLPVVNGICDPNNSRARLHRRYYENISLIKRSMLCKVTFLREKNPSSTVRVSKPCNIMITLSFCKFCHVDDSSKRETNSKIPCTFWWFLCIFSVHITGLFPYHLKTSENHRFSKVLWVTGRDQCHEIGY